MEPSAAMGASVRRFALAGVMLALMVVGTAANAAAADRYALIVSGAAGSAEYEQQYSEWRMSLSAILRAKLGFPDDHVIVLADASVPSGQKPTRENVRAALASLRQRATKDDVVLIFLIGHGNSSDASSDGAKFNLVGPDLSAKEWAELVRPIAGLVLFVDGASGSAPYLEALSARGRIVVTATDTTAQQYETIFPEFFIHAFTADDADADKNGRVSIWEAFSYASSHVREWYQQRGRLQTERPLLDDNGDGVGREAQSPGPDGALAQVTYLDEGAPKDSGGDPVKSALLERRSALQNEIDQLKAHRADMPPPEYDASMERLLVDLARVDAQLRSR
jgi:hypothetical protein